MLPVNDVMKTIKKIYMKKKKIKQSRFRNLLFAALQHVLDFYKSKDEFLFLKHFTLGILINCEVFKQKKIIIIKFPLTSKQHLCY